METIPQAIPVPSSEQKILYGTFWYRLGSGLIDNAIGLLFSFPFKMYFGTETSTTILSTIMSLVVIAYKPFMEYRYGATIGKMALTLKVVDYDYKKAGLMQILLRNVFHILPALF